MKQLVIAMILSTLIFNMNALSSQNLSTFRWHHRIILLLDHPGSESLSNKQWELLGKDREGLKERKLLVIRLRLSKADILFPEETNYQLDAKDFSQFRQQNRGFTFLLIGLDGGVKLRKQKLVSREYLYALIDGMPMRRAEMREKGNKN